MARWGRGLGLERVRLDVKTDCGALFVLELELHKRRLRAEVEPVGFDVAPSDRDRLDRLVDRLGADGLDFDFALASDKSGDGACDRVGAGVSGYA